MDPEPASTYNLVLTEPEDGRAVGDNVFLANLPADYKVYVFYYSGTEPNEDLAKKLRAFGEAGGKNVFVNFAGLDDPAFTKMIKRFQIGALPAIIVTAIESLASPSDEYLTTFARLDEKKLLASPDRAIECVERLFILFLEGKVKEAISHAKWQERAELARALGGFFASALKGLKDFIFERDFSFSMLQGKFELKKHGK